jgi:hypothetical protein
MSGDKARTIGLPHAYCHYACASSSGRSRSSSFCASTARSKVLLVLEPLKMGGPRRADEQGVARLGPRQPASLSRLEQIALCLDREDPVEELARCLLGVHAFDQRAHLGRYPPELELDQAPDILAPRAQANLIGPG